MRAFAFLVPLLLVAAAVAVATADDEVPGREAGATEDLTDPAKWDYVLKDEGADPAKTFVFADGEIHCTGRPAGYMVTKARYERFTLTFDWKYVRPEGMESDRDFRGNSGYLLFVQEERVWPRSVEVQGMNRDVAGIIPIRTRIEHTTDVDARRAARKPVGEWNSMEIVVTADRITASINGTLVSTVTQRELNEGPIGFQSEGAEIHWKNIRIRRED